MAVRLVIGLCRAGLWRRVAFLLFRWRLANDLDVGIGRLYYLNNWSIHQESNPICQLGRLLLAAELDAIVKKHATCAGETAFALSAWQGGGPC